MDSLILLPLYDDNKVLILVFDRLYYPVKLGEVLLTVFQYLFVLLAHLNDEKKKTKQNTKAEKQIGCIELQLFVVILFQN